MTSTLIRDSEALRPLPAEPQAEIAESRRYRLKQKMLGNALDTDQLQHERLGKPTALAVFASDALSSTAYATEEILRTLIPASSGCSRSPSSCRSRWRWPACSSS